MAGNLPTPAGVEVRLIWNLAAEPSAVNVLHFMNPTLRVIDQTLATAIGNTIKALFGSSGLAAQVMPNISLAHVLTRDMSDNTNQEIGDGVGGVPGQSTSPEPLPPAVSLALTIRTGKRGRSFNGRMFLWGFGTDTVASTGQAAGPLQTAAVAFGEGIRTSMTGSNNLDLAVLSRFTTPPGAAEPIERQPPLLTKATAVVLRDANFDTQRRRAIPGI